MNPKNITTLFFVLCSTFLLVSCVDLQRASLGATKKITDDWNVQTTQHGKASWYSVKTNSGTRTASGERLSNSAATAAHKTLPLGTQVRVTNLANGKSEIVRITDRGPYIRGRIIDVTIGCAERLGFVGRGVTSVKIEVLKKKDIASNLSKKPSFASN
jgi:rare lipoprotein A